MLQIPFCPPNQPLFIRHAAVAVIILFLILPSAWADTPIRFAPLPMENREAIVKAFNPLVMYLETKLQRPVEMVYYDSHREILAAFEQGALDIIFLGPLPYITLQQRMPQIEPLIFFREADGAARYRCALITFVADAPDLSDLRGKAFGLTQPLSTCGVLGANAMLQAHAGMSLEETRYRYLGTHEAVIFAVVGGEVAAGSVKDEFARKYEPLGVAVRAWSDEVPGVGLFASTTTLTAATIARIRDILLTTPPEEYRQWGATIRHGMLPARDADFAAFRQWGDPSLIPQAESY